MQVADASGLQRTSADDGLLMPASVTMAIGAGTMSPSLGSGAVNVNVSGSAQIDALLDKVAVDQDRTQQAADANAADTLLWDQTASIPLYQKPTLLAYDSSLRDVRNSASQSGVLWNSDDWTLQH